MIENGDPLLGGKNGSSRSLWLAHLSLLFATTAFSLLNVFVKMSLSQGASALVFGCYRDSLALPILIILAKCCGGRGGRGGRGGGSCDDGEDEDDERVHEEYEERGRRGAWVPRGLGQWLLVVVGGLFLFGNQALYLLGVKMTGSVLASIYTAFIPVITAIIAVCVGQESLSPLKIFGVAFATTGVVATAVWGGVTMVHSNSVINFIIGNVVLFVGAGMSSGWVLMLTPIHKIPSSSPFSVLAWQYTIAASSMAIAGVVTAIYTGSGVWVQGIWTSTISIITIVYAGIICSSICYALMTWAITHTGPTVTCLYGGLQIPITALLDFLIQGQPFLLRDIIGGLTVMIGLVCSSCAESTRKQEPHNVSKVQSVGSGQKGALNPANTQSEEHGNFNGSYRTF